MCTLVKLVIHHISVGYESILIHAVDRPASMFCDKSSDKANHTLTGVQSFEVCNRHKILANLATGEGLDQRLVHLYMLRYMLTCVKLDWNISIYRYLCSDPMLDVSDWVHERQHAVKELSL